MGRICWIFFGLAVVSAATSGCLVKFEESGDACGDGVIQQGEVCDGENVAGMTCEGLGFGPGPLHCRPDCLGYDTHECGPRGCGNGVLDHGEECDEGDGNSDELPDACRTDCRLPHCGDGVADEGETCDGSDLRGLDCSRVFDGQGTFTCAPSCIELDVSHCLDRGLGAPCEYDEQCRNASCLGPETTGLSGWYCTQVCETSADCPDGAECVVISQGPGAFCVLACTADEDCLLGQVCLDVGDDVRVCVYPQGAFP